PKLVGDSVELSGGSLELPEERGYLVGDRNVVSHLSSLSVRAQCLVADSDGPALPVVALQRRQLRAGFHRCLVQRQAQPDHQSITPPATGARRAAGGAMLMSLSPPAARRV